ncbi:hypothetical protein TH61_12065 [Rufibacter sp. DG15C]|uniref:universal stress protein n=1 Tax=Rufibacter sp. DG15C TaxID=1379909 RepID=UPI00078E1A52|nr:universal stress protein [Rufibacter sp. DG15C]AMM51764.1 hypothetical protein TH61_12065 [Rufibacter sp. DG15C]
MNSLRILLPFNFTDACVTALRYAYQFADHIGADITLLHCTGALQLTPTFESQLVMRLRSFAERHARQVTAGIGTEPLIECSIKEGDLRKHLTQLVDEWDIDMLVSPADYLLAGLEQQEVVALPELVKCPILLVPSNAVFQPLKEIVFSLDVTDTNEAVMKRVQKLAQKFNVHLTLLHLHSQLDGVSFCQVKKAAATLKTELPYPNLDIVCQEEDDLLEGLNSFSGRATPDLFVLATRDTHLLQEYFSSDYRKTSPGHLRTPLLNLYQARKTPCSASCRHCNHEVKEEDTAAKAGLAT